MIELLHQQGLLISLDIEKAFDSIDRKHILEMLDIYGFGENFKKWVTVLYANATSCVINRGYLTEHFSLERGVRQGDPLSPYLFILTFEALAMAIRHDDNIKPIDGLSPQSKLVQYADDTTVFLGDKISIRYLDGGAL